MTSRVKHHPDIVLRLIPGLPRTEFQRMGYSSLQIDDFEVQVHRDPLGIILSGPDWRDVAVRELEGY